MASGCGMCFPTNTLDPITTSIRTTWNIWHCVIGLIPSLARCAVGMVTTWAFACPRCLITLTVALLIMFRSTHIHHKHIRSGWSAATSYRIDYLCSNHNNSSHPPFVQTFWNVRCINIVTHSLNHISYISLFAGICFQHPLPSDLTNCTELLKQGEIRKQDETSFRGIWYDPLAVQTSITDKDTV